MAIDRRAISAAVAAALGGMVIVGRSRRRPADPAHAEGHRHLAPPPEVSEPAEAHVAPGHDQPYVRTTHLDSQRRRFRR